MKIAFDALCLGVEVLIVSMTFSFQRFNQCTYNYPTAASEDPYKVTLQVGQRKFVGIGHTVQSARHDAASKYEFLSEQNFRVTKF